MIGNEDISDFDAYSKWFTEIGKVGTYLWGEIQNNGRLLNDSFPAREGTAQVK